MQRPGLQHGGDVADLDDKGDAGGGFDALDALLDDVIAVLVGHTVQHPAPQLIHQPHLPRLIQHLQPHAQLSQAADSHGATISEQGTLTDGISLAHFMNPGMSAHSAGDRRPLHIKQGHCCHDRSFKSMTMSFMLCPHYSRLDRIGLLLQAPCTYLQGFLDDAAAVHLHAERQNLRAQPLSKCQPLLGAPMLQKLLDDVVAKHVAHQLQAAVLHLLEHLVHLQVCTHVVSQEKQIAI